MKNVRNMYRSVVTVKKQVKGRCHVHKIGDCFAVENGQILCIVKGDGVCIYALAGMLPLFSALSKELPKEDWMAAGVQEYLCIDPENTVLFELRREKIA